MLENFLYIKLKNIEQTNMMRVALKKFTSLIQEFTHDSKSIGITLLFCTVLSLVLANTTLTSTWFINLFSQEFTNTASHHFHFLFLTLPNSSLLIINDFLMALFFLLAGMEIKRELTSGELASFKKSILPIGAAIGGMIVPAILYFVFNKNTAYSNGWGIPMATDIAFTLGIATLLGDRVPVNLKIFITALAIIDDLGAISVIAFVYGDAIQYLYLLACVVLVVLFIVMNKLNIAFGVIQIFLGIVLWYCMFNSGVHATVAGVIFAFLLPIDVLPKLEEVLYKPVYFIVLPLFVLANTAIVLPTNNLASINTSVSWGIILGLFLGKPIGIVMASYLLIKFKIAQLPLMVNWLQLVGASILAGIGFTMSIFIANLAFSDIDIVITAKIAVLLASALAMLVGFIWLKCIKVSKS